VVQNIRNKHEEIYECGCGHTLFKSISALSKSAFGRMCDHHHLQVYKQAQFDTTILERQAKLIVGHFNGIVSDRVDSDASGKDDGSKQVGSHTTPSVSLGPCWDTNKTTNGNTDKTTIDGHTNDETIGISTAGSGIGTAKDLDGTVISAQAVSSCMKDANADADTDTGTDTKSSSGQSRELRIAVVGNVDSGKSTLVGVLSRGNLDDGRW
jgi:hypothetical protein